jgi:hypothetical protein
MSAPVGFDENEVGCGVVFVTGIGARVGVMLEGNVTFMDAAAARELAPSFETSTALAHGLGWLAEALRESAENLDALTATKQ